MRSRSRSIRAAPFAAALAAVVLIVFGIQFAGWHQRREAPGVPAGAPVAAPPPIPAFVMQEPLIALGADLPFEPLVLRAPREPAEGRGAASPPSVAPPPEQSPAGTVLNGDYTVTVAAGDTVSKIFERLGIAKNELYAALRAEGADALRHIRPRESLRLRVSDGRLLELGHQGKDGHTLLIRRTDDKFITEGAALSAAPAPPGPAPQVAAVKTEKENPELEKPKHEKPEKPTRRAILAREQWRQYRRSEPGIAGFPSLRNRFDKKLQQQLEDTLIDLGLAQPINDRKLSVALVDITDLRKPRVAAVNGDEMMYAASLPKIAIMLGAFG